MVRPPRIALALLLAAGCAATRSGEAPDPGAVDPGPALDSLRVRSEETGAALLAGTILLALPAEKHFLHFEAALLMPDRFRFDVDLSGPLGFGKGRLTVVRRGETIEALRPDGEIPIRGGEGDEEFRFLDAYGLTPSTAPYLVAPYGGPVDLFREDRVVASGIDARSGAHRLILRREDGRREVLMLEPSGGDLLERRVVEPGGEVHLVCEYRYDDEDEGRRLAREVKTRVVAEDAYLTVRFSRRERDVPIHAGLFFIESP
ncbi:MAG: hypothetical protein ABIK65_08185 [Candidatus Eisenbacteria bacterium]